MKPSTDVIQNRKTFVESLKANELGLVQNTDSSMIDATGAVCALGYGCKLFEVDLGYYPQLDKEGEGPYEKLGRILGLKDGMGEVDPNTFEYIWHLNDLAMKSFKEIGENLEIAWGFKNLITADMLTEIKVIREKENYVDSAVGSKVKLVDVMPGDVITVDREVAVKSVDLEEGVVYEAGTGYKVRLQQPRYGSWTGKALPEYSATLKNRKVSEPDHWPPQRGDVWEGNVRHGAAARTTYHILKSSNSHSSILSAFPDDRYNHPAIDTNELKLRSPKLVYRIGNALK